MDANPKRYDVLGLGCATVDDLLFVDEFPAADTKTAVVDAQRQCGGLTATALVAAARFGASCCYAGVLGTDPFSNYVEAALGAEGIELSHVPRDSEARPIHSTIVVARGGTRNIFFFKSGATGAHDLLPDESVIASSRVLFLDHYGMTGNLRAAAIARRHAIPVVADIENDAVPHFGAVLELVDHLIVSQDFACRLTGTSDAQGAALALAGTPRQALVVTCGDRGCWYADGSSELTLMPAFTVPVVDTTGCGDVFHGVYAAALAQGADMKTRLRYAAAAAAIKATRPGGQTGIPRRAVIEEFLLGTAPPA